MWSPSQDASSQSNGFAGLCIGCSENDSSSRSPSAHAAQGETLLKIIQQIPVPPDIVLSSIPGKDEAVSPWASSTSLLVLIWREIKCFLFPKAWCCPSIHLASAAVSSHKGLLKAEIIFCHALASLTAFPGPFWALSVPASVGWRDCQEIWVVKLLLFESWQKPGSFQYIVSEKDSRLETVGECVCLNTHHGALILPALAWTSCLGETGTSFSLISYRRPRPCVQREFLTLLLTEVIFRTNNPVTLIFCPQGTLRCSMTWCFYGEK